MGAPQEAAPDRRTARQSVTHPRGFRRCLGLLGLAVTVLIGMTVPAHAQPGDPGAPSVPNTGVRPEIGGTLPSVTTPPDPGTPPDDSFPDTDDDIEPPPIGPLASQIIAERNLVAQLGEQVLEAEQTLTDLQEAVADAREAWEAAEATLEEARGQVENAAREAYQDAAALPDPLQQFAPELRDLARLAPGMRAIRQGEVAAEAYQNARELAESLQAALEAAEEALRAAESSYQSLSSQYEQRNAALEELEERNRDLLAQADQIADDYWGNQPGSNSGGVNLTEERNLLPAPQALAAVQYARAQVGKRYEWGAEGPNAFDCSGLVWAAYRSAGVTSLPRTARQQYLATRPVAGGILPGDLIFFSNNRSDWNSIYHVGIYIGNGQMVHAANPRNGVTISAIPRSDLFAVTRVVPAVPRPNSPTPSPSSPAAPNPTPPTNPPGVSPSLSPRPTTSPSASASPSSPSPSSPTPSSPSPSVSASPSPSVSPGEPGPSQTPSSPTPSASSSAPSQAPPTTDPSSADPCLVPASPTPSGMPTPSTTPSPSPSPTSSSLNPDCVIPNGIQEPSDAPENTPRTMDLPSDAWLYLVPSQKAVTLAYQRQSRLGIRGSDRRCR